MKHYFVCAFQYLVDSQIPKHTLYWVVFEISISSVHLEGIIDNVETFICSELFGHCAVHSVIWVFFINAFGSVPYHKSTCFKVNCHS